MINQEVIQMEFPAQDKYLNVLGASIGAMLQRVEGGEPPEGQIYGIELAVQETCTNIVRHAYAEQNEGRIKVTLTFEKPSRRFIVDVRDTGRSFNPSTIPAPSLGKPQVHGYGLFLMDKLMDEVTYCPEAGGNHWRLVKNL